MNKTDCFNRQKNLLKCTFPVFACIALQGALAYI